jgi:hypothetical protein
MTRDDPNFSTLTTAVRALGDLCDSFVFIGGCATGLLVTTVRSQAIRITTDVDVITEVTSLVEYHEVIAKLCSRGFYPDQSGPICRYLRGDIKLDVMSPEKDVLGFHNKWYSLAVQTAKPVTLSPGVTLRLVSAPAFIATKIEAFRGRGNGDFLASHDVEDMVTVVDGRPELVTEVQNSPLELRRYLASTMKRLLDSPAFRDALAAHLPPDLASQARLPIVLARLQEIATSN